MRRKPHLRCGVRVAGTVPGRIPAPYLPTGLTLWEQKTGTLPASLVERSARCGDGREAVAFDALPGNEPKDSRDDRGDELSCSYHLDASVREGGDARGEG